MNATDFRLSFTPLPGFFSLFPHGTCSLSVNAECLALGDGPPVFRQGFSGPALLGAGLVPSKEFRVRGFHPLRRAFPGPSPVLPSISGRLLRVRSPLLAQCPLISFPAATEMVQFAAFASAYCRCPLARAGSPIRTPRPRRPLSAPPRFSQTGASFVASHCLSIRPSRLIPWPAHLRRPPLTCGPGPAGRIDAPPPPFAKGARSAPAALRNLSRLKASRLSGDMNAEFRASRPKMNCCFRLLRCLRASGQETSNSLAGRLVPR